MNKLQIVISILVLFSPLNCSLIAQTDTTIIRERGNLELLTERIYLAFKAYNTGNYKYNTDMWEESKKYRLPSDSIIKIGQLLPTPPFPDRPLRIAVMRNGEITGMRGSALNNIPADSIQSIEIMRPSPVATALYGAAIATSGIVIRLKGNKEVYE